MILDGAYKSRELPDQASVVTSILTDPYPVITKEIKGVRGSSQKDTRS